MSIFLLIYTFTNMNVKTCISVNSIIYRGKKLEKYFMKGGILYFRFREINSIDFQVRQIYYKGGI